MIHHICHVLPPHVLREIVKRGSDKQKDWALKTLEISSQLRGRREIIGMIPTMFAVAGQKRITVFDAKNLENLPGILVREEGDSPVNDIAVNEAYDGAEKTYDFYKNVFSRNSVDDKGMRLDSTVHYSQNYDNAFWNGSQMVYGDGDGQLFQRFTISVDVIGHEFTHGITQYEAALEYQDQSGALNEHMSDVFGSLVKQYSLKQTADEADWLIGAGLFTPNVKGRALRSMKEPGKAYDDPILGKDPQPDNMKDYQNVDYDDGGVHINSGIPNKAFYLVASEIGGYAWEKAGKIWYITLRDRLRPTSDFQNAADLTYDVAGRLFGVESKEQNAVKKGWKGIGITV
jgi:Zn-dependent metalloprotease